MAEEVEERFYEVVDTITRSKTVRVTADIVNEDETWEDVAAELAGMDEGVVSSDEDRDVDSVVNVTAVILAQRATTKGTDKVNDDESEDAMLCESCGGNGSGPPVLVCCNNYRMGRRGESICCDNPVYVADGYCSDCGGSGSVKQQAPPELQAVLAAALNGVRPPEADGD